MQARWERWLNTAEMESQNVKTHLNNRASTQGMQSTQGMESTVGSSSMDLRGPSVTSDPGLETRQF
jgi:hypothetical protein